MEVYVRYQYLMYRSLGKVCNISVFVSAAGLAGSILGVSRPAKFSILTVFVAY